MRQNSAMRPTSDARDVARQMAEATAAWLHTLDDRQRARASFALDDERERTDWAYFPRDHRGLPLLDMTPPQQKHAHRLLTTALSLPAYARVCSIMALESVLNHLEERSRDAARDPGRYFLSVFGAPGDPAWSWRFEGHHVCLNFTLVDGAVASPTPLFLGANPSEVHHGGTPVLRPCAEEEDLARELLAALEADQRVEAVLCPEAPPDIVLMNAPRIPESGLPGEHGTLPPMRHVQEVRPLAEREAVRYHLARPKGVASSRLDDGQRALLQRLVEVYIERLPEPLSALHRDRVRAMGEVYFAWAGSDRRHEGHYYRLQAGSFLVEYDNTQDGANHIHAVWRDAASDFGYDALRQHLRAAH